MASSGKSTQSSVFCHSFKMLIFLTLMCLTTICNGKAFPEETKKSRGKRMYNYGQQPELYRAYPQYYSPLPDGQPIYIPTLEQSDSYMNFLENYYKSFNQPQRLVTPAPYSYDSSQFAYNPDSRSDNLGNYELPGRVQNQITHEESNQKVKDSQYYAPDVSGEKNVKYTSNEDKVNSELKADSYEKPALLEHGDEAYKQGYDLWKTSVQSEYEDQYGPPAILYKYKRKFGANSNKQEQPEFPNIDPKLEKENYEKPVLPEYLNKDETYKNYDQNIKVKPESEYEDGYKPPISHQKYKEKSDKLNKQEKPNFTKVYPELAMEDYETPVIHKKTKEEKVEGKQNEKSEKLPSNTGYKNVEVQATKKKSKGKPKNPPISKKYGQIPEVSTEDNEHILDSKIDYTISDKLEDKYESQKLDYEMKEYPIKSDVAKPENEVYPVKMEPEVHPVKTNEKVIKKEPEEPPVKIKEKVVIKTEPKAPPVKIKEKVVVKTEPKKPPVKTKEKVVVKTKPEKSPVKTKEKVVVKTKPKQSPVKTKENVKTKPGVYSVKTKEKVIEADQKEIPETYSKDSEYKNPKNVKAKDKFSGVDISEKDSSDNEESFEESGIDKRLDTDHVTESFNTEQESLADSDKVGGDSVVNKVPINIPRFLPNRDSILSLSSLNSNILSLIFNPNASPLKLKKCLTRSNETGYCQYVQHCNVPQIATSLEQLLNNACVIDDIFIGVCCPEFPVETVKVHWEQSPSDSDKRNEDEFGHNPEDCGIRSDETSNQQSWPWKAPLVSMSNGKIFCGGVLISEEYVLTAAHCTTKIPKNQILVRLGQFDDSSGEDFAVVEIKRHAQYNPRTMHNDIALLKLGRRIIHDPHTGVICLPEEEGDTDDHEGEKATLLGWRGIFGTKSKDPEFLEVMSNEECTKMMGMKIPSNLLCTEARNESERTCNADSGAPLVIEDDGKYEVIGILSWNRNDCNQRFPSTFSRVSSYVGWIQKHAV